jgi:radical SAM protein with 4Fe4S-binding SPASM domain
MPPIQPPRIVSWNVTFRCPLKCSHCYSNSGERGLSHELDTQEGKDLLCQLAEAGTGIVILSGGEPLLREDIFDLSQYGTNLGLRMAMGTSGICITDEIAGKLQESGMRKVAVSLDSTRPSVHDRFRGYPGAFDGAIRGISLLEKHEIPVQLNVTVTRDNYEEISSIIRFGKDLGAKDIHLFFLVPTGRGSTISDISPDMYEEMIRNVLVLSTDEGIPVRPTCAPQFMRIARQLGLSRKEWTRGCIAGRWYCRIDPAGVVTPCPYLPVSLGKCTETRFEVIWDQSEILGMLRDTSALEGKCGRCEYAGICGGCRARAYGLSRLVPNICGDLDSPGQLSGNMMAEEPWCPYQPAGVSP